MIIYDFIGHHSLGDSLRSGTLYLEIGETPFCFAFWFLTGTRGDYEEMFSTIKLRVKTRIAVYRETD